MDSEIIKALKQNRTVLLADGGSTKMDWLLVKDGHELMHCTETGINPVHSGLQPLHSAFDLIAKKLPIKPDIVGYYGAGCVAGLCGAIAKLAELTFGCPAECGSDLLLAARLLAADEERLVCILGTGSNSGLFCKGELTQQIPSLGCLLGDEGGAVDIGRRIIRGCLRGKADKITMKQWGELGLSLDDVMKSCYGGQKSPAAFIGSMASAMRKIYPESKFIQICVSQSLENFFDNIVDAYKLPEGFSVCFVGAVADAFADTLKKLSDAHGLKVSAIVRCPFDVLTNEIKK